MEIGNKISIINGKEIGVIENFEYKLDQFGGLMEFPVIRINKILGNKKTRKLDQDVNYLKTVNPFCVYVLS